MASVTVNEKLVTLSSVLAVYGDRKRRTMRINSIHDKRESEEEASFYQLLLHHLQQLHLKSMIQRVLLFRRLDGYYRRDYKDYFEFMEGAFENKEKLTEAEQGILDWLKANR